MHLMKFKEKKIYLLVDPELLQMVHYGIDIVKVLHTPDLIVSVSMRPGNRRTDHTLRKRLRDAGDGQPLPLPLVHQDVIHCTGLEG